MSKKEKIAILKIAAQLVYKCSEHTPPEVKQSMLNMEVAHAALSIEKAIKYIKSTQ